MKTHSISESVARYKTQERESHVLIDDVLHKASQEIGELLEAAKQEDIGDIHSEAADTLVNIYSAMYEMGIELDTLIDKNRNIESGEINDIPILYSKWNQVYQSLRGRYSRDSHTISDLENIGKELIESILQFSNPELSIAEIIQNNTKKFKARVYEYIPEINIKDYIKECQDFPIEGISFKDISPILESPEAFRRICMEFVRSCQNADLIVGLDARGFLFGTSVAEKLGIPFVMARKKGKLPGNTVEQSYGLEYGDDVLELQEDAIKQGQKVAIIDDLLATGGTAKAAIQLIEKLGGQIDALSFVVSLDEEELLQAPNRKYLEKFPVHSITHYH